MKFILSSLFSLSFLLATSVVTLTPELKKTALTSYLEFYEDTTSTLSLADIQTKVFTPFKSQEVNFSASKSAFWFKFNVYNTSDESAWFLQNADRWSAFVDVYVLSENTTLELKSGEKVPFSKRDVKLPDPIFKLIVPKEQTVTVYIKIKAMFFYEEFTLSEVEHFLVEQSTKKFIKGIFFGIVIALILYNIILAINLRSRRYTYYVLYLTFMILFIEGDNGLLFQYLHPEYVDLNGIDKIFFVTMGVLFLLQFNLEILEIKAHENSLYWIGQSYSVLLFISMVYHLIMQNIYSFNAVNLLMLLGSLLIIYNIVIAFKRKYTPVYTFALGYFIFLFFGILILLNSLNIIFTPGIGMWGISFGLSFEAILFSYALYRRLRFDEKERLRYELEVRKKDKILLLQSRMAGMGEMLGHITHQWKQPLSTISAVVSNLELGSKFNTIAQEDINESIKNIQEQIYLMEQTSRDFLNYYKPDKEAVVFNVSKTIHLAIQFTKAVLIKNNISFFIHEPQQTIQAFGYTNELNQALINIINNAKDALIEHKIEDKNISITLSENSTDAIVEIEDNAGGIPKAIIDRIFDPYFTTKQTKNGTGLGLQMSKQIVEESMRGKLNVRNSNKGAVFTIILPKV